MVPKSEQLADTGGSLSPHTHSESAAALLHVVVILGLQTEGAALLWDYCKEHMNPFTGSYSFS